MDLSLASVLLIFFAAAATSYPRNSDALPKDYYKRQILQPIPGYIPVYIRTDEQPIIKKSVKPSHNYQSVIKNTDKIGDANSHREILPNIDEIRPPPKEGISLNDKIQIKSKSFGKVEMLESTRQK